MPRIVIYGTEASHPKIQTNILVDSLWHAREVRWNGHFHLLQEMGMAPIAYMAYGIWHRVEQAAPATPLLMKAANYPPPPGLSTAGV
jgi:hypothetical protein